MSFGVTPQGFVPMLYQDVYDSLAQRFKSKFGEGINTTPQSNFGRIIGICADLVSEAWGGAESVYNAQDPDAAQGQALDKMSSITGARRLPANHSVAYDVAIVGLPSFTIPAGTQASTVTARDKFALMADAILDGSGNGTGDFQALDTGPIPAAAHTLTIIETPVAGLTSFDNGTDAVLGRNLETDPALRQRRAVTLHGGGNAALDKLLAVVSEVAGVTEAGTYENATDAVDASNVPPHAIEVVVIGGADAALAQAIYATKAGGILAYGLSSVVYTDRQGQNYTIGFSRIVDVDVYVTLNVTKGRGFPVDGADQIAALVAAYGDSNYHGGSEVVSRKLSAIAFGVAGVIDSADALIDVAPTPTSSANLFMTRRQRPKLDVSRIIVNVS